MMVSKSNFMQFHHNVPEHMNTRTNLPYHSIKSPTSPTAKPSLKQAPFSTNEASQVEAPPYDNPQEAPYDTSRKTARVNQIMSSAQQSMKSIRRKVHFSQSVRSYSYAIVGKKVSQPSFRQLARQGGIDVTRDNCLPRQQSDH